MGTDLFFCWVAMILFYLRLSAGDQVKLRLKRRKEERDHKSSIEQVIYIYILHIYCFLFNCHFTCINVYVCFHFYLNVCVCNSCVSCRCLAYYIR